MNRFTDRERSLTGLVRHVPGEKSDKVLIKLGCVSDRSLSVNEAP